MNFYYQAHKSKTKVVMPGHPDGYPYGTGVNPPRGYSLRQFHDWSFAFLRVFRASDMQHRYVFFADGENMLSLNSPIGTGNANPQATTLGDWAGNDDVYAWWFCYQQETGGFDSSRFIYQSGYSPANAAQIISGGSLLTDPTTGYPIARFTGNSKYQPNNGLWTQIQGTNAATIVTIARNPNAETIGYVAGSTRATSAQADMLKIWLDRRTSGTAYHTPMRVDSVGYNVELSNYITSSDLLCLTSIKDATDVWGYVNGVQQGSKVPWSGTFDGGNDFRFTLGFNPVGQHFVGDWFETMFIDRDESAAGNLVDLHNYVNQFLNP